MFSNMATAASTADRKRNPKPSCSVSKKTIASFNSNSANSWKVTFLFTRSELLPLQIHLRHHASTPFRNQVPYRGVQLPRPIAALYPRQRDLQGFSKVFRQAPHVLLV